MSNEIRKLRIDELDTVSGGGWIVDLAKSFADMTCYGLAGAGGAVCNPSPSTTDPIVTGAAQGAAGGAGHRPA